MLIGDHMISRTTLEEGVDDLYFPPAMNIVEAGSELGQASGAQGNTAKVGIRPEHIALSTDQGMAGTIRRKEQLGGESYLYMIMNDRVQLVVKTDGENELTPGQTVFLTWPPHRVHRFDAQGRTL